MSLLNRLDSNNGRVLDVCVSGDNRSVELIDGCDCYYGVTLHKKEFGDFIAELKEIHKGMENELTLAEIVVDGTARMGEAVEAVVVKHEREIKQIDHLRAVAELTQINAECTIDQLRAYSSALGCGNGLIGNGASRNNMGLQGASRNNMGLQGAVISQLGWGDWL